MFGSCIIYILYTGCAKIKKIIPEPKGLTVDVSTNVPYGRGLLIFRSNSSDMKVQDSKEEDSEEAAGWIIEQSVL